MATCPVLRFFHTVFAPTTNDWGWSATSPLATPKPGKGGARSPCAERAGTSRSTFGPVSRQAWFHSALRIPHPALVFVLAFAGPLAAAELTVTLKDQKGLAVEDCVVSLTPLVPLAVPTPPAAPLADATVRQVGGEFWPYVTAVRVGTRVHFPNEDQVQHHVYSVSPAKRFEIPLFGGKDATDHSEVFDQPGVVSIGCNIHDWMVAYIVVLDTPLFAVSSVTGTVRLADLPPGRYRCEVWHPRLAQPIVEEITFAADGPAAKRTLELTLKVDRRVRRALEGAAGGVYR